MLLRSFLCGGVWNGFFLEKAEGEDMSASSAAEQDGDGHLFWGCSFLSRELPDFFDPAGA